MAEVMFKRGKQANLPQSNIIEGCFYLTTDSNRLYVGKDENTMALLNQTVQIVDNLDILKKSTAHKNDFYYCTDENILAVYNGSEWVQINPDTDTNDTIKVEGISFDEGVENADGSSLTYTLTLKQKQYNKGVETDTKINDLTAELVINSDLIAGIIPEAAEVSLAAKPLTGDGVKIITAGAGSLAENLQKDPISLIPGDNVSIALENTSDIVINAKDTTYDLTASANDAGVVKVSIVDDNDLPSEIAIVAGEENDDIIVRMHDTDTDTIVVEHKSYNTGDVVSENDPDTPLKSGETIQVISGLEFENGHVTGVTSETLTLPNDIYVNEIHRDATDDWKATLKRANWELDDLILDFSTDIEAYDQDFRQWVEEQLAAVNTAMTYKGAVTYDNLPTKNVEVGDVYLLTEDYSDDEGASYKKGDMFIAYSTSGSDTGIIGNEEGDGDLKWSHIPSGDELNTDTLFYGDVAIDSTANEGRGQVTYGISAVVGSNSIDLTPEGNEDLVLNAGLDLVITGTDNEVEISHKEIETDIPEAVEAEGTGAFTAVTNVTVENGHITSVTRETFTPKSQNLEGNNNKLQMVANDNSNIVNSEVEVNGDHWVNVEIANDVMTLSHNTPDKADVEEVEVTNETELVAEGDLTILSKVTYDATGHIVGVETDTLKLPEDKDTTYELIVAADANADAVASETENPYLVLSDDALPTYAQIMGDGGSVKVIGNANTISVSLVWGSFDGN